MASANRFDGSIRIGRSIIAMSWLNSPAYLLLGTGSLLGLSFPLGKLGTNAGISAIVWAFAMAAGASLGLLVFRSLRKQPLLINRGNLVFYFCAASVSLVIPNILVFSVIPKLGSGFVGLLFTLSPPITLAISSIWQVRLPNRLGLLGIAFGFIGALVVGLSRGEVNSSAGFGWVLAGLAIPASLAIGNVFRTTHWPKDAEPMELAIGMNLAAALVLFVLVVAMPSEALPGGLDTIPATVIVAVLVTGVMVVLHARLQFVGGPTYLSQIGYVAAAVALSVGTVLFGEAYSLLTWFGALIILIGSAISAVSMQRK